MSPEGSIEIQLFVNAGTIDGVIIHNQRFLSATASLIGRPAEEAVRLLAKLFSVCRIAQGLAGAAAIEKAAGFRVGAIQDNARHLLLLGETILEHGTRAGLDWPILLGEEPVLPPVKGLRGALADLHRDLYPDGDWMRPGGGRLSPESGIAGRLLVAAHCLDEAVFAGPVPLDIDAWNRWVAEGNTPAARLVARLQADNLAGFGASTVTALPALDLAMLEAQLAADSGTFVARPLWQGAAHETGPLARRSSHPLVAALLAEHGPGMVARIGARLVELILCLREMQNLASGLCNDNGTHLPPVSGRGLGVVEAARGRLVHRVELEEGRVSRYQILAPTEWNFHPEGPLALGLLGHAAGAHPVDRARLLVAALDPCVACRIEVA